MTSLEDTLKIIGMAAIGILGIVLVLGILATLCVFLGLFAYVSMPDTPTVTISPISVPANDSTIGSTAAIITGQASAILADLLSR